MKNENIRFMISCIEVNSPETWPEEVADAKFELKVLEQRIDNYENMVKEFSSAMADAADVMSESIQHGLEIGSTDWEQMKKCKKAMVDAVFKYIMI